MIRRERCIVLDIDGTLCPKRNHDQEYADLEPYPEMCARVREYVAEGFYIILHSSRNMNTYDGNVGLIYANTAKVLHAWLEKHQIPYNELHLGKPWVGAGGFYVDDKSIRPDEFLKCSYDEICSLISTD
jgi:capsule biosynthesis phosphatase